MKTTTKPTAKVLHTATLTGLLFMAFISSTTAADFTGTLNSVSITDSSTTNKSPVANITYTQNGAAITFDASGSSDPDGNIIEYKWDFGDGGSGNGENVSHVFASDGTYPIVLTVVDNNHAIMLKRLAVTISPPVSCADGVVNSTVCNPTTIPAGNFSKNADRTNVTRWTPDKSGTINRIKIYFGTPTNGTWNDFVGIKVVVYRGNALIASAPISPTNNAWVWSEKLAIESGKSLSFDTTQDLYFGLSVKEPVGAIASYAFGYFNDISSPSFYYKSEYLPSSGTGWGMHTDKRMAAILEYIP